MNFTRSPALRAGHIYLVVGASLWAVAWAVQTLPLVAAISVGSVLVIAVPRVLKGELSRSTLAIVAGLILLAGVRGWMGRTEEQALMSARIDSGPVTEMVEMTMAPRRGDYGYWALAHAGEVRRLLRFAPEEVTPGVRDRLLAVSPGDGVLVNGTLIEERGTALGRAFAGVITVDTATIVSRSRLHSLAASIRDRVLEVMEPERSSARALLAGFLIGETSDLPPADVERLRGSGLSHFVAVSGSNVALFLGLVFLISGPMAWSPRSRAAVGLVAIVVFVVTTRFEPSVIRAGTMAGVILGGRLVGISLDGLAALGVAIGASVMVAPAMANDVGFALSALATFGVLVAVRMIHTHDWGVVRRALVVTLGAQMAVAPLLVVVFGTVPVAAPVANLIAAPLVTVATITATVAAITGFPLLVTAAASVAGLVLGISALASGMGQLGPVTVGVGLTMILLWWRFRRLRSLVGAVAVVMLVIWLIPSMPVRGPVMIALDVGQGDSILLVGARGETMLVDGGPDEEVLLDGLRRYGVDELDLVVVSHVHADHVTGLTTLFERLPVRSVWLPTPPHSTPAYELLTEKIDATTTKVARPRPGITYRLGTLEIEVLAPLRRYASPNDQSIVLRVTSGSHDVLLSGDIEETAQEELQGLKADILKVPHQGAATSDLGWLDAVDADVAVISVGPNDFGHPAPEVIATLETGGARVRRTDLEGDIVVPLGTGR